MKICISTIRFLEVPINFLSSVSTPPSILESIKKAVPRRQSSLSKSLMFEVILLERQVTLLSSVTKCVMTLGPQQCGLKIY